MATYNVKIKDTVSGSYISDINSDSNILHEKNIYVFSLIFNRYLAMK